MHPSLQIPNTKIVAHQQLRAHLRGSGALDEAAVLERVGAAQAVAGSVRHTERLANRHWTLVYLQDNPDWQGAAILVDKPRQGGQVVLPDLGLEAPMHLERDMPLNSEFTVAVKGINLPRLEVHLEQR